MRPERAEQAAIVKLLKSIGAVVYVLGVNRRKSDYQGTMMTPGLPDLVVFLPEGDGRRLLFIEVKGPEGRLSSAQVFFRTVAQLAGIPHLVGGLDVVLDYLKEEGYCR